MRMRIDLARLVATLAAVLLLTSCAPTQAREPSGEPLDEEAVRELLVGNTLTGSYGAERYTFFFESDGKVYGELGMFRGADSASWTFKDGRYCHWWAEYFGGIERCYRWYRTGPDTYLLKNADAYRWHDIEGRIVPGKPRGF